jgi:DNA-binding transcriptional regulator YiaG
MRPDQPTTSEPLAQASSGWDRTQVAELVLQFEAGHCSQRAFAEEMGVPRSTLQHWLKRKQDL